MATPDKLDAIVQLLRPSELAPILAALVVYRREQPNRMDRVIEDAFDALWTELANGQGCLEAAEMVARAVENF